MSRVTTLQPLQRITFWGATLFHLGPVLFNIFINDLFLSVNNTNTISAFSKDFQVLIKKFQNASEYAIKWFTNNCMIVNPGKLQSVITESSKGKIN